MRERDDFCPSRRALLQMLGGAVVLPGALTACSSGGNSSGRAQGRDGGNGPATVPASEVPVGHARVVLADGEPVVVAHPSEGRFVAFSAACTHQGSTVAASDGLTLVCPNHGSRFNAATGAVERGPAASPLPAVPIRQEGNNVVLG